MKIDDSRDMKCFILFWAVYAPILLTMWCIKSGGLIELIALTFIGAFNIIFYLNYLQYKLFPEKKEPEAIWTRVFEPDFGFKDLD